ncbi:Golgi reassembly-stacking protein 2 [Oryzias melastigma]|nr:Golgi reassembly-stacking protein 2 [Oryzias melastigma]KAF6726769.1 Golgi reassembly-stacking protein 2 [Oryzias melastigma]
MGGSPSVQIPGGGSEGYHVLKVQENSPGHQAGLEPFFDFIISVCDTRLNRDNDTLKELLRINVERPVKMLLYSSKTLSVRETAVTPSNTWGGRGLLGVSIRFCSFQGANENVWHVLEVEPNSPASSAGLRAYVDYIIGADADMSEGEDLFSLIEAHEGRELKMYVYSTDADNCREVIITPNSEWGGKGSLGCGIGFGYLHRIPTLPCKEGKTSFPAQTPDVAPASIDGLSEVPLSAVTPTVPVVSASAGLELSLATLSVSSNQDTERGNLPTGLMPHSGGCASFYHPPNVRPVLSPGTGMQHSGLLPPPSMAGAVCSEGLLPSDFVCAVPANTESVATLTSTSAHMNSSLTQTHNPLMSASGSISITVDSS